MATKSEGEGGDRGAASDSDTADTEEKAGPNDSYRAPEVGDVGPGAV